MTTEWPFLNLLTHTLGPSSLTFQGVVNSADYSSMIDGEQAIKSEIEEKLIDCAVREENIIEVIDVPSSDEDARCTSDFAQNENDMLLNMTNETQSSYVDVRPSESELSLKTEQVDYCIEDDHNGHVSLKEDNNHYEQREIPLISNVTNECFLDCHFEEVINQDSFDEHLEILEDGICEQSETICDITEELIQNCESEEAKNDEFLEERVDVSEDSVSEEMCFEYLHNNGQDVKCKIEPITSEIDSSVSGGVIKSEYF